MKKLKHIVETLSAILLLGHTQANTENIDGPITNKHFDNPNGNLYKEVWPVNSLGNSQNIEYFIDGLKTNEEISDVSKIKTFSDQLGVLNNSEASNLVGIYAALADCSVENVLAEFGGRGFGDFKPVLADLAVAKLSPIGDEMRRLLKNPGDIDAILAKGADRAAAIARPVLAQVHDIIGFLGKSTDN